MKLILGHNYLQKLKPNELILKVRILNFQIFK
jgi:hypothetical protein